MLLLGLLLDGAAAWGPRCVGLKHAQPIGPRFLASRIGAAKKGAPSESGVAGGLAGKLVEFEDKSGRRALGLVKGPDPKAKKAVLVMDATGLERSVVTPKQIKHVVERAKGSEELKAPRDVAAHADAAEAALARPAEESAELISTAWEFARELAAEQVWETATKREGNG